MTAPYLAPEMGRLAFFQGAWEGSGGFWETPLMPATAQPVIKVEAAFRHGGHWLEQRFTWIERPELDPETLAIGEATRIWRYDYAEECFVGEWFDSGGRRATVRSPGWENDRLVATIAIAGPGPGPGHSRGRETFVRVSDREWTHHGEFDFGSGWIQTDEQRFHRVA